MIDLIRDLYLKQAKAEQEEEFISNTLLKKIQALKKEKETLAHHYEQEEECLTNDLSRKLLQVRYHELLFSFSSVQNSYLFEICLAAAGEMQVRADTRARARVFGQ